MIILENSTNMEIDIKILDRVVNSLNINQDVELLLVDNNRIKSINKEYRGVDKVTDVLSFPLENIDYAPLGSIVISTEKALEVSAKLNHSIKDEITLLFIHGVLHLLGYDHEIDNGEMREKELELIKKFDLPNSLIIRSGEE